MNRESNNHTVVLMDGGTANAALLYTLRHKGFILHPLIIKEVDGNSLCASVRLAMDIMMTEDGTAIIGPIFELDTWRSACGAEDSSAIHLIMAASYARSHKWAHVAISTTADEKDAIIKIDNAQIFLNSGGYDVQILAPFRTIPFPAVIAKGQKMGVPWEKTWSCQNQESVYHCGTCRTCKARLEAFKKSGVLDPITFDHVEEESEDDV
jgi:hypothetical protein